MPESNSIKKVVAEVLKTRKLSKQSEILAELKKLKLEANQSSVSRALQSLGAIKVQDLSGKRFYKIPDSTEENAELPLKTVVQQIASNSSLIVVRAQPGLANLVALEVEKHFGDEILGTIAGDDTVFIAPRNTQNIRVLKRNIQALTR